jgi:nitroreductase
MRDSDSGLFTRFARPFVLPASEQLQRARDFEAELSLRRSIRDFSSDDVPREVIEACIKAAGSAPSGANQQPWHFVAIRNPEIKQRVREAAEADKRFLETATLRSLPPVPGLTWLIAGSAPWSECHRKRMHVQVQQECSKKEGLLSDSSLNVTPSRDSYSNVLASQAQNPLSPFCVRGFECHAGLKRA